MTDTWIAGCGDLGLATAGFLLASGHRVVGLRRRPPAQGGTPGLAWAAADLTRPDTLATIEGCPDQVIYAAAAPDRTEAAYRATYVEGLQNLGALVAARGAGATRLVFVSSSAVIGDAAGGWVDESTPCRPEGFRGEVMLEAEAAALDWPGPSRVARLTGLYGPGRTALLRRVRQGDPCRPEQFGNRIHRVDAARMLVHLMDTGSSHELFLGVDDAPVSECEVMRWLAGRLGVEEPEAVPAGDSARGNKRCSNARLRADGFQFEYPTYREGYAALIDGGAS